MSWARVVPGPAGGHTGLHFKPDPPLHPQRPLLPGHGGTVHTQREPWNQHAPPPPPQPRQDKASAPSDRAAAAGSSLAPGPGFVPLPGPSSQVLAAFSLAGGSQLTAQIPDTSQPPQAWPFLRQHTRGPRTLEPTVTPWPAFPTPAWTPASNRAPHGEAAAVSSLNRELPSPGARRARDPNECWSVIPALPPRTCINTAG